MKPIHSCLIAMILVCACAQPSPRSVEDFNFGWKFQLGDDTSFAEPGFDDSSWRELHLPHDWSIEGEFSADNPSTPGGGALPGGIGWYRKVFPTPDLSGGKQVFVEFDGVFMNSTVYVNGKELGTRPYGYSSFTYDITDCLNAEGDNVMAVRCDNADQPNSRWYAGCGIYRNVRLVTVNPAHIQYNGLFVTTPEIDATKAKVHVEAEAEAPEGYRVNFKILDAKGKKVAFAEGSPVGGKWAADLEIASPHLWDIEDTYQYTMTAYVVADKQISDSYAAKFGVRKTEWDADKGFLLNGRPVKMLGVCLHHDMGCLGTAVHKRALERQLTILKEMGCNAIRTSHNPPAPELLDLCDEMGFLVMDEAFDMWRLRKTQFDYARFFDDWHEKDLRDFLRRDRNHPSVVMWSIGNEIVEQWVGRDGEDDEPKKALAVELASIVREMDSSRVVTSGCDDAYETNNIFRSGALDVFGINYRTFQYDNMREIYPTQCFVASETTSSLNTRGFYVMPSNEERKGPNDIERAAVQCTAYDDLCASWSELHEYAWGMVKERDWMAGAFVWTGFDYLGEPTPYSWPARSSYFGIVDLAGFPKDAYYMYQSEWNPDVDVLHLFPHWNWAEGDKVDVWCYFSGADEVELFLNGKSLGRSHKEGYHMRAQWLGIDWEPGTIEAVSYKDGEEVARTSRTTTGAPVALKATPDRSEISADGYDLCYVTITAVDDSGRDVPTATSLLKFKVEGEGELVGVDNGDPTDHMCLKGDSKALFAGKALAVVRSLKGEPGTATLSVSSDYASVKLNIKTK